MKFKFRFTILLLSVLNTQQAKAQTTPIDSLKNILLNEKIEVKKVDLYNQIAQKFLAPHNFKDGIIYSDSALILSKKIKYIKGQGSAELNKGTFFTYKGAFSEAIVHIENSIKLNTISGDKLNVGKGYSNLGVIAYMQGRLDDGDRSRGRRDVGECLV